MGMIINTVIFLLSFLTVLSLLVFIHELGHYSVARFFKVRVERFSIGFGKPIWKRRARSGTLWSIGAIPLGGFVQFWGDASAASNPDQDELVKIKTSLAERSRNKEAWKECLHFKPLWQRALVVLAGPVANFVLAILIYAGLVFARGVSTNAPIVDRVSPGTPAAAAGLMADDRFVAIDGKPVPDTQTARRIISLSSDTTLKIEVLRDGQAEFLTMTPEKTVTRDAIGGKITVGRGGFYFADNREMKTYSLFGSLGYGTAEVKNTLGDTFTYIGRIFTGKEDGKALGSIVKIGAITGKVGVDSAKIDGGFGEKFSTLLINLLGLAAAISVALGFANLLPIPVLDGGHLMFYAYEAVMRRPLSARAQEIGFQAGFALLITLFLVLTFNDIGYVTDLITKAG